MNRTTSVEYLVLRDAKGRLRVATRTGARKLEPFATGSYVTVAEGLTFAEACARYFRARFDGWERGP